MDFQGLGDLAGRLAFNAQRHGVKTLGHAWLLVLDGFLAQLQQQLHASFIAFGKYRAHIAHKE
jgi:hypothetical protein